ncbi:hypothetical protein ASPTUDRAFT_658490 [Aspergillus tubingensis CBS 134.48]|uniref:Uncharacterized protein n=1 Tax=Aspergillus tubingensis (strain CBS 134.48) TaxID=767770 RepID=A0A1L9N4T2_ASPTC|nr:hypothetical protein ASPTUDRAFT_658490 [Aspergillus tubingensis CBS 134.48]
MISSQKPLRQLARPSPQGGQRRSGGLDRHHACRTLFDTSEIDEISPLCMILISFLYMFLFYGPEESYRNWENIDADVYTSQLNLHVGSRATFSHMLLWNNESDLD